MTKTSSDALDPPTLPHGQGISARPQADPYRALRDPPSEFGAGGRPVSVPKDHRRLPTVTS